jgi:hypothetical protein
MCGKSVSLVHTNLGSVSEDNNFLARPILYPQCNIFYSRLSIVLVQFYITPRSCDISASRISHKYVPSSLNVYLQKCPWLTGCVNSILLLFTVCRMVRDTTYPCLGL